MKIRVVADSTCDLSAELVEQYGITIVPLTVTCDGKSYQDGVDIDPERLLAITEATGGVAATAAVNMVTYAELFTSVLKDCDAIVHFTISSAMSGCYQNACLAAEEVGNVYVVDSENLSTGIGHLVLDACILAEQGMDAADIKAELDRRKKKLDVSFVLSTLEYLRRGGRCTSVAALGANLLKLHPCIGVTDGKMGVGKKYRGNIQSCLVQYVKDKLAEPDTVDPRRIFITGCTVSCHCGPGCLGILFYRK